MAFTSDERQKIRDYLGVPSLGGFLHVLNQMPDLNQRLDEISANQPSAESSIRSLLGEIDQSRSDIKAARGRLKAKSVEGITLNESELTQRWREDFYLCQQLAIVVQFQVVWHPSLGGSAVSVETSW